jgi:hypothetical protein
VVDEHEDLLLAHIAHLFDEPDGNRVPDLQRYIGHVQLDQRDQTLLVHIAHLSFALPARVLHHPSTPHADPAFQVFKVLHFFLAPQQSFINNKIIIKSKQSKLFQFKIIYFFIYWGISLKSIKAGLSGVFFWFSLRTNIPVRPPKTKVSPTLIFTAVCIN